MLGSIRKLSDKLVTKILLGVLVFIFISLGFSSWKTSRDVIVTIDGKSVISLEEFLQAKRKISHSLNTMYSSIDPTQLNIDQLTLHELIKRKLLNLEIERLNLVIDDDIIVNYIKNNKSFHDSSDNFDKELFKKTLIANNLLESDYVNDLKLSVA